MSMNPLMYQQRPPTVTSAVPQAYSAPRASVPQAYSAPRVPQTYGAQQPAYQNIPMMPQRSSSSKRSASKRSASKRSGSKRKARRAHRRRHKPSR